MTKVLKSDLLALSFFSGAMGLDIGLEKAGIKTILASEIDKTAIETIRKNKPGLPIIGDIRDYGAEQILNIAGLTKNDDLDVVVGGPPCQAFSSAGCRLGFEDERGNVFLKFIDIALGLRPKYILMENVRGLLSAPLAHRPHNKRGGNHPPLSREEARGGALMHILGLIKSAGYGVSFNLYNAAFFGTPQIRERVIILCSRGGDELPFLSPKNSKNGEYGLPRFKTFAEAVTGLPEAPKDYIKFPERRLRFYRLLGPGQNWRNLPKELQKEALGNSYYAGGGKTGFLRRLAWDKPSPTLVTHPAMPATDLAHPEEDRPLSVQEYKRIQEFPEGWEICGSIQNKYRQIGNAVPVSLGKAAGESIVSHFTGQNVTIYPEFRYSRYNDTDHKRWRLNTKARFNHIGQLSFEF